MRVCMDFCACIDMMQGHNGIAEFIAGCDEVFIPAATFAEVTEGFYNRGVASTAGIAFGRFLNCENVHFRAADYAVADRYALIARSLRRKGRMIPQNLLQAQLAFTHTLPLPPRGKPTRMPMPAPFCARCNMPLVAEIDPLPKHMAVQPQATARGPP